MMTAADLKTGANLPAPPAGLQKAPPGRPRQNRVVTRVDWQLDSDVVAALDAERARTGEPYHQLLRRLTILALPEHFDPD